MSDYALYVDPHTKVTSYKRFAPRSNSGGDFPDFNNFKFDGPEGSNSLKFAVSILFKCFFDKFCTSYLIWTLWSLSSVIIYNFVFCSVMFSILWDKFSIVLEKNVLHLFLLKCVQDVKQQQKTVE